MSLKSRSNPWDLRQLKIMKSDKWIKKSFRRTKMRPPSFLVLSPVELLFESEWLLDLIISSSWSCLVTSSPPTPTSSSISSTLVSSSASSSSSSTVKPKLVRFSKTVPLKPDSIWFYVFSTVSVIEPVPRFFFIRTLNLFFFVIAQRHDPFLPNSCSHRLCCRAHSLLAKNATLASL